jgi:hypothetical protein
MLPGRPEPQSWAWWAETNQRETARRAAHEATIRVAHHHPWAHPRSDSSACSSSARGGHSTPGSALSRTPSAASMLFERPGTGRSAAPSGLSFAPSSARVTPSRQVARGELDHMLREIGSLQGAFSVAPAPVSEEELRWLNPFAEPAPPQTRHAVAPTPPRQKPVPPQAPVAAPPRTPKPQTKTPRANPGVLAARARRSALIENGSARKLGPLDRAKAARGAEEAAERRRKGEEALAREIKLKQERDLTPRHRSQLKSASKPLSSVFQVRDTGWYADPQQQRANGY